MIGMYVLSLLGRFLFSYAICGSNLLTGLLSVFVPTLFSQLLVLQ